LLGRKLLPVRRDIGGCELQPSICRANAGLGGLDCLGGGGLLCVKSACLVLSLGCCLFEPSRLGVGIGLFGERRLQSGVQRLAAALCDRACREERAKKQDK
jgi:hypothetical protein